MSLLLRQLRRRIPDGPPYRPAVIRWADTHPVNGWHDPDTLDDGPCVITSAACRAQRARDMERLASDHRYRVHVMAYWWWGWDIHGTSGLGKPGSDL